MARFYFFIFLLIVGLKYGYQYAASEDFQKYADRTKAPWTCQATIYLGDLFQLMDSPIAAKSYYDRVPVRCPKTKFAAEASYGSAYSIDQMDRDREAVDAYQQFIEEYKDSPLVAEAKKNIARIQGAKIL